MKQLETLGKVMSTKEVAEILGVDEKFVRHHYVKLNGSKVGGKYFFTERGLDHALQTKKQMDSKGKETGEGKTQKLSEQEGCEGLGVQDAKDTRKRLDQDDRHDIFGGLE